MPNFKPYIQNQPMLLPPDIRDIIPNDHIGLAIDEVVNNMDLSCVESGYTNDLGGASAYSPLSLLKILFYGYSNGIRSSRLIEKKCREDLVFRYLVGNGSPDHSTINLFRKRHLTDLEYIFAQIVVLCGQLNITDFSHISIDGSVFKASASKKNTFNREEIAKWRKRMKKVLKEAEEVDKLEDKKYGKKNRGYDQLPIKLADPKTRRKEIKKLVEKMDKLEKADKQIKSKQEKVKYETALIKNGSNNNNHNIVDGDANLMKLKNSKAVRPSYNGQIATSNQIITAYDVVGEAIDEPCLFAMIDKTEANTKEKVKTIKADCGYWSKENMQKLANTPIDAYIPDRRKSFEERGKKDNTLPKNHRVYFTYNKTKNEFTDPEGYIYKLKINNRDKQGKVISQRYFREKQTKDNIKDNPRDKSIKNKRTIVKQICVDWELEGYKTTMRAKLNTKEGKQIYLTRMYDVEPVFGNIKHNQKMNEFLCRGKPMVKIEFGLTAIAHNFTKLNNWIKDVNNRRQFEGLMKRGATI